LQARLRARLAEHQSARAAATAEAARREQLTASTRRQLEQLLGHAQKTQNLQLLLRKLKVVDAGPPMASAELKESLKKAKVRAAYDARAEILMRARNHKYLRCFQRSTRPPGIRGVLVVCLLGR
jgi:hypothetical protein